MAYDRHIVHTLYKKLLAFYPKRFRERLGESMEQTFNDLYRERKRSNDRSLFGFVLVTFSETALRAFQEHFFMIREMDTMKNIFTDPRSAAVISFILILPIGFLRLILGSDIEPLIAPIESILTVDGNRPNAIGWTIICGGMLLLPLALVLNFRPLLKRDGPEGKRNLPTLNIIVGVVILALILSTWGGLLLEEIYCLQGIRCD